MFTNINDYILLPKLVRQNHLRLDEPCTDIGGDSRMFRGLLSHHLGVTIPKGHQIHLCHACNNAVCSNVAHLYWGTAKENQDDSGVREKGSLASKNKGPWNKGLKGVTIHTEASKKKISDARKKYIGSAAELESGG